MCSAVFSVSFCRPTFVCCFHGVGGTKVTTTFVPRRPICDIYCTSDQTKLDKCRTCTVPATGTQPPTSPTRSRSVHDIGWDNCVSPPARSRVFKGIEKINSKENLGTSRKLSLIPCEEEWCRSERIRILITTRSSHVSGLFPTYFAFCLCSVGQINWI